MPITVPCAKCKTRFQVPSKLAGTTVRCAKCGCMIRLPSSEAIRAKKQNGAPRPAPPPRPTSNTPSTDDALAVLRTDDAEAITEFIEPSPGGPIASAAADPAVISCNHCEGLLYYDPNFANQTVACPHCGNHLTMPEM